ncbi:virion core protein (lumpy skin disease virus) [Clostridium sp. chh4-2]|uniref:SPFH domain-containing protein n=1 Tax=Clostridium sp. chh4-2 TaxID=2067550 RepID=UPI000CCF8402|nr:SPFH domain-containing protein [Clostridium sp. chh4-2]PNV63745.1 virion core protein (lumpy skin disease virus) [Clostridium sp. chh4-2]
MAILDVIKFDGLKSRDWIIFKYFKDNIVLGSQLIVKEGQVAIFVKGGQVCDVFYPGTYTLSTSNLPILQGLVNLPFGGRTPFSAEIYYINTTTKLDIEWGTTDPIQLIDPKYFVKLRIRAFGQMGLKLRDYTNFFRELIGGMNQADVVSYDKLKKFYKGLIVIKVKSIIADTILTEKISALEIATKLEEISDRTKEKISLEFEKYGLDVVNFYVQSINFPDEDFAKINQILEEKAAFEIMGDGRYVTKRSFDVYEGAATNENGVAGVFAAGGLGLGASMNMGQAMSGAVGNPMQASNAAQTAQTEMMKCPKCGKEVPKGSRFCLECGENLTERVCECGEKILPGAKFCSFCGRKVE